jgi:hypothetical protein
MEINMKIKVCGKNLTLPTPFSIRTNNIYRVESYKIKAPSKSKLDKFGITLEKFCRELIDVMSDYDECGEVYHKTEAYYTIRRGYIILKVESYTNYLYI